ncbi:putative F-box domain, leucine-rich repeat domain superfamily, F-box-like domain superfamily [Helianthus anomalus]
MYFFLGKLFYVSSNNLFLTVNVNKRRFATRAEDDRISNLPQELIELILEKLTVQDAAKTSVLPKTWRHRWTLVYMQMVNVYYKNVYYKRWFVSCAKEDRISNLPDQLIKLILEKLPVQDAARISILSKTWRYRRTSMSELIFREQFIFSWFKMLRSIRRLSLRKLVNGVGNGDWRIWHVEALED